MGLSEHQTDHLMVVEDEPAVREAIVRQLHRRGAWRITAAGSVDEAIERFKADPAGVVLIDIRLGDRSGIELVQKLREITRDVRPIMMSGWGEIQDTITALRAGAVDFFQKPFKLEDVVAAVEHAFQTFAAIGLRRSVRSHLVEERRTFRIPNDLSIVPHVIAELTHGLEDDARIDPGEIEGLRTSLHEAILNAIEHGNLGISYEEKSKLLETADGLRKEIERRAQEPRYRDRTVTIVHEETPEAVTFRIADEGEGFDHRGLPDPTQMREAPHGRGILICRVFLDELRYNEAGNEVTLVKKKNSAKVAASG